MYIALGVYRHIGYGGWYNKVNSRGIYVLDTVADTVELYTASDAGKVACNLDRTADGGVFLSFIPSSFISRNYGVGYARYCNVVYWDNYEYIINDIVVCFEKSCNSLLVEGIDYGYTLCGGKCISRDVVIREGEKSNIEVFSRKLAMRALY